MFVFVVVVVDDDITMLDFLHISSLVVCEAHRAHGR